MKFTDADIAFMESLNNTGDMNSNIYYTAKFGKWMRNLDRDKLKRLEEIYKRVMDMDYSMCYHCSNDIMKLVLRLYDALYNRPDKQPTPPPDEDLAFSPMIITEPKKKERK